MTTCGNTCVFSSWPCTEKVCQALLSVINYSELKTPRGSTVSSPKVPASWFTAAGCPMQQPHGACTTRHCDNSPAHSWAYLLTLPSSPAFKDSGTCNADAQPGPAFSPVVSEPPTPKDTTALRQFDPKPYSIQPNVLSHGVSAINSQESSIFQQTGLQKLHTHTQKGGVGPSLDTKTNSG